MRIIGSIMYISSTLYLIPLTFSTALTKVVVVAHIMTVLHHDVPQDALRLGVVQTLGLPAAADFGHCVEHGKLSSRCWVGLEVLCCFIDDFHHCFAGNICSLVGKRDNNTVHTVQYVGAYAEF